VLDKIYSEKRNIFVCPTDPICVAVCVLVKHCLKDSYMCLCVYIHIYKLVGEFSK